MIDEWELNGDVIPRALAREGIKAVVDGGVSELGGRYVLSARLVSAQTGEGIETLLGTIEPTELIDPTIGRHHGCAEPTRVAQMSATAWLIAACFLIIATSTLWFLFTRPRR